jgi:hypothetical protein
MLNATTVDNTRALASHNLADLTIDTDAGTGTMVHSLTLQQLFQV